MNRPSWRRKNTLVSICLSMTTRSADTHRLYPLIYIIILTRNSVATVPMLYMLAYTDPWHRW